MKRRRSGALVATVIALALVSGACTKNKYDSVKVVEFVDATTPLSNRFVYTVDENGHKATVQGLVQDDFKYKMQLATGGSVGIEEIVSDDAVAIRFLDPTLVEGFADKKMLGVIDQKTDVPGASVFDALRAKRWVLDQVGAPAVIVVPPEAAKGAKVDFEATNDPIFDARTALAYVRGVGQSSYFRLYDPESLEPTYRADEDPFPKPHKGSGVTRYDSIVFPMPAPAAATQGSASVLPGAVNFRKMAVYVKSGRIIEVREFTGVTARTLKQFQDYMVALVSQTAPDDVIASFKKSVAALQRNPDALAQYLLQGLNTYVAQGGRQPVRFRTMSLKLQDFNATDIKVTLPTEGVIKGNLAVLRNLGRKPLATADANKPPSGINTAAPSTATTLAAPSG